MSLWNPDNIRDIAESVGISSLPATVTESLARDVEYRVSQVLASGLRFRRKSKRIALSTQDVEDAVRELGCEPLYGYGSTRPLKFGEASIGPGQPLFYVEDEECEFEKVINAPLPKVPREIAFTAHWLAVEGVQPSIPQNPTAAESRNLDLAPKNTSNSISATSSLAAVSSNDNVRVKPLVKHVLSMELQLYFERTCASFLDRADEHVRQAAWHSLRDDPGLHQLVPYFIQFIAEKVTHGLKDLFVLEQMMNMTEAIVQNKNLYIDPYVANLVPPVLTCLLGQQLGEASSNGAHFALRDLSASLMRKLCQNYSSSAHTLKSRLARSCLKKFLDPAASHGSHYGAILGLQAVGGAEGVRVLIIPNLLHFEMLISDDLTSDDSTRRNEADKVVRAILSVLGDVANERATALNGDAMAITNGYNAEEMRNRVKEKIGEVLTARMTDSAIEALSQVLLSEL